MLTNVIVSQNCWSLPKERRRKQPASWAYLTRAPCTQRLHATCPFTCGGVTVPRTGAAAAACASNEVSRLTPTPNVFWAEKSLARSVAVHFRVPCRATRSLTRSLWLVHVRGSPMQCKCRRRLQSDRPRGSGSVFRPGNVAIVEDRPGQARRDRLFVSFFSPLSFRLSFSFLPLPRDSPPFPNAALYSPDCALLVHARDLQSARARFGSHYHLCYNFTLALSLFLFSLYQTGRTHDNFRFFMSNEWSYLFLQTLLLDGFKFIGICVPFSFYLLSLIFSNDFVVKKDIPTN